MDYYGRSMLLWVVVSTIGLHHSEATTPDPLIHTHSSEGGPLGSPGRSFAKTIRNNLQPVYIKDINGSIALTEDDLQTTGYDSWLWVLDLGDEEGFGIDLNVTKAVLPTSLWIHSADDQKDEANGDFLIIGPGKKILGGIEGKLLWGNLSETLSMHITSPVAYIFLRSSILAAIATNSSDPVLVIHYARTGEAVTTIDPSLIPSTLPPPPSGVSVTAVVALNGVSASEAWGSSQLSSIKNIIADIAMDFATSRNLILQDEIKEEDVTIEGIGTCHPFYCWEKCTAYNVSIRSYLASNWSWVFTEDLMNMMFADEKYHENWENAPIPCQVCPEKAEHLNWYVWLVGTTYTWAALVIMLIAWALQRRYSQIQKRKDFEKQLMELEKERARRSSGDVSVLGLGVWGDSVASRDSRRLSLPFPRKKTDDSCSDNEDETSEINLNGYQEFIPDRILIDAAVLGLEKDLANINNYGSYFNDAFVDDESITAYKQDMDEDVLYERQPSPVTMDSDSDDPDAINFRGYRKSQSSLKKSQATVDVHNETCL